MHIVHVASEVAPYCQSGGLGEVVGSLPTALARETPAISTAIICPYYRIVDARLLAHGLVAKPVGEPIAVRFPVGTFTGQFRRLDRSDEAPIYFFDCPQLFDRDGIYGDRVGEFQDNPLRFGVFARAVLQAAAQGLDEKWVPPDIFHLHDWQTGLLPLFAQQLGVRIPVVFTVHNLAFQGVYPKSVIPELGLPWSAFRAECGEFYDRLSFIKVALCLADRVTTVSPAYAREILEPAHGEGLDGFLRSQVLARVGGIRGIVNGIDMISWDPGRDTAIATPFDSASLDGRAACQRDLLAREFSKPIPVTAAGPMVIGMVSRLTYQKGVDLVCDLVPELHALDARLIVHGSGAPELEDRLRWLAERFADHLSVHIGFDANRARRIYAGSDVILVPSRFEPCGLSQLFAMRYGAIPIAHRVGGLIDTVRDTDDFLAGDSRSTGFCFSTPTTAALRRALERARATMLHADAWHRLVRRAMATQWDWHGSARAYAALYAEL